MKQFKPSEKFVADTMHKISQYEQQKKTVPLFKRVLPKVLIQCSMIAAGILFGVFNIVRMFFIVFAPSVCR